MPFVNLKILQGATPEQKSRLIRGITEVVSEVLEKDPGATYVVIDEVNAEHWGIGGKSISRRRRESGGAS